jgi:hypothetical protein
MEALGSPWGDGQNLFSRFLIIGRENNGKERRRNGAREVTRKETPILARKGT